MLRLKIARCVTESFILWYHEKDEEVFFLYDVCPAETSLVCRNINLASWWGNFTSKTYIGEYIGEFALKILNTIKN